MAIPTVTNVTDQTIVFNAREVTVTGRWSYFVDFAVAVGYRGSETGEYHLRRLWIDESLVFDAITGFRDNSLGITWDFYDGKQTAGDPIFRDDAQIVGSDEAGAFDMAAIRYPGMMYIVIRNLNLNFTGLRYPKVTAEVWGSPSKPTLTEEFSNDPGGNVNVYAADFVSQRLYTRTGNTLNTYDLDTLTLLDQKGGFFWRPEESAGFSLYGRTGSMQSNGFFLVPWLNIVVYSSISNSAELFFKDVVTGRFIDSVGIQGNNLFSSVDSNRVAAVARYVAIFNPENQKTYVCTSNIVASQNRNVQVFEVSQEGVTYLRAHSQVYSTSSANRIQAMRPGRRFNTIFILYENCAIIEFNILSGDYVVIREPLPGYLGRGMIFDQNRGVIVANFVDLNSNNHRTLVYDTTRNRTVSEIIHSSSFNWPLPTAQHDNSYIYSNTSAGTFAPPGTTTSSGSFITLSTGSVVARPQTLNGVIWDSRRNRFVGRKSGNYMVVRYLVPFDRDDRILLSEWLKDVGERLGYSRANIITQNITDTIIGAIVIDDASVRSLLNDVCAFYQINMVETGNGIRFTRRDDTTALAPVATLTRDDFVAANADEGAFNTQRTRPDALPERVQVWYLDRDADFQPVPFQTSRNRVVSNNEIRLDLPLVLEKSDVAYYATAFLYEAWSVQLTYSFSVLPKHIRLEPGDAVTVIDDDYIDVARIGEVTINGDWSISISAVSARDTIDLDFITDDTLSRRPAEGLQEGDARSLPIAYDGPLLDFSLERESEAVKLVTAVSAANRVPWPGASLYRAQGGNTPALVGNVAEAPPWGRVIGVLGPGAPCATDMFNVLRVVMPEPEFSQHVNEENSQNMVHVCAVGFGNFWEVMTFGEFTYEDGVATFSKLTRGRFGTDYAIPRHEANEAFIYFSGQFLASFLPTTRVNETFMYLARGFGQSLGQATAVPAVFAGGSKRPYPPSDIRVVPDGGDLIISWRRRDRLGYIIEGWKDNGSETIPLNEANETYRLTLKDALGEVVREWEVTTPEVTYTAAEITADAFIYFDRLSLELAQVSALVGNGFTFRGQVNVTV